ncbi:MAG: hypothetical protein S4CHLAM6_09600 [Chlamydiae bacterium]|nr:hypothetical protein [Chlamydiota bacterium]
MSRNEYLIHCQEDWISAVVDESHNPKVVVIMSHGLTGDKTGPQKILSNMASSLVSQAHIIRFDYRGSGDSSGDFSKTTFESMYKDLELVVGWSKEKYKNLPIVFIGFSIGGVVSILSAYQLKCCSLLVLLSCDLVDNPDFQIKSFPKSVRQGQFFLDRNFFTQRSKIAPRILIKELQCKKVLFFGSEDKKVALAAQELEKVDVECVMLPNSDHLFESYSIRLGLFELINKKIKELNLYDESSNTLLDCKK